MPKHARTKIQNERITPVAKFAWKLHMSRFKSLDTKFWLQSVDWSLSELPLMLSCLRLQLLPIIRPGRPFCKTSSNSPLWKQNFFMGCGFYSPPSSPNLTLPPHLSSQRMDWMLKSEQSDDVWGFNCCQLFDPNPFHPDFKGSALPARGLDFFYAGRSFIYPSQDIGGAFMQPK